MHRLYLAFVLTLFISTALCQDKKPGSLNDLKAKIGHYFENNPSDKIFLHIDKHSYSTAETVWIKAYLTDAHFKHSNKNGVVYLEFIDSQKRIIIRKVMRVYAGGASTGINLDPASFPNGEYYVRAYTNWMRNFSSDHFFIQKIVVGKSSDSSTLTSVKRDISITKSTAEKAKQLPSIFSQLPIATVESEELGNDSLKVTIKANPDLVAKKGILYLVGYARETVCINARLLMLKSQVTLKIAKNIFPTGITRIALFDDQYRYVNELPILINVPKHVNIDIKSEASPNKKEGIVTLAIQVKDSEGKPIMGNFSIAITNDDTLIPDTGSRIDQSLFKTNDRYDWNKILTSDTLLNKYPFEREFTVRGKVKSIINAPVKNTLVSLFSSRPLIAKQVATDEQGSFIFNDFPQLDTTNFFIQAVNKNGKSFNVGVELERNDAAKVELPSTESRPESNAVDTTIVSNQPLVQTLPETKAADAIALQEVSISARKFIKGSKNLNGIGNADQVMDENDIAKAGKMSLEELLKRKIDGFAVRGTFKKFNEVDYHINKKIVHFVIDGVYLDNIYLPPPPAGGAPPPPNDHYVFVKNVLGYFNSGDITGIEVLSYRNALYVTNYGIGNATNSYNAASTVSNEITDLHAYIEITTQSKQGPYLSKSPGIATLTGLQFANPIKYISSTDSESKFSTIHWEPNFKTNKQGEGKLSFPIKLKDAGYKIIIQGISTEGLLGYKMDKLETNQDTQ